VVRPGKIPAALLAERHDVIDEFEAVNDERGVVFGFFQISGDIHHQDAHHPVVAETFSGLVADDKFDLMRSASARRGVAWGHAGSERNHLDGFSRRPARFISGINGFWLGDVLFRWRDVFCFMPEEEEALLVSNDVVGIPLVADARNSDLRPHAGVVIHEVRDEFHIA